MSTTPSVPTDVDLVDERLRLLNEIDVKNARIAQIDALLLSRHQKGDRIADAHGNTVFTVGQKSHGKFNEAKAREVLSPAQIAAITVPALDSAKAKAILPPALYRACFKGVNTDLSVRKVGGRG